MPKYRIKERPIGPINGQPWPAVGEVLDLPAVVGDGMPGLERVATQPAPESRPARVGDEEKRPAATAARKRSATKRG